MKKTIKLKIEVALIVSEEYRERILQDNSIVLSQMFRNNDRTLLNLELEDIKEETED